jgi:LPS-assembly protein
MTRFSASSRRKRLFSILTVAISAASFPTFVAAQASAKQPRLDDSDAPTTLEAEQMSGRPDREVVLENNVEIIRGGTVVNADKATYNIVEDEVEATGNIRIRKFGDHYTGDELRIRMDTGQGYISHPTYRLEANNAQGSAERIDFEPQNRATVTDGTYSTCEGPDPDWYLQSSKLNLDKDRDVGSASQTIVYFKGVPILATPYMSFPLSSARKSGVLPPTIGTTSKGGLEISLPYYFNIAPNRDLTLYPRIITRRGLQLGAQGRYLGETYSGETRVEGLIKDRVTGVKRYAISSTHTQTLAPQLTFSSNLNHASDDDYPNDFPGTITAASQRLLPRDLALNYSGSFWSAAARATNYQVLQDPAAKIDLPYARLPQLTFQAGRQNVKGFDWLVNTELTRFWHPDNLTDYPSFAAPSILYPVAGNRAFVNPNISYPVIRPGYFVTPKLSLHATQYSLDNPAPGAPSSLTRVLPTFSVDSGLIFERDAGFLGNPATQTLEPRLFYVYTPYRDQNLFPNFDTAPTDFNFSQIFSENRFSGHDRISDANQVTAALTSRYMDSSGTERLRVAVAQRFNFEQPRVALTAFGEVSRSDLLASVSGQLTASLSSEANMQYSQSRGRLVRANYGIRWQPKAKHVLNLAYRQDTREELALVDRLKQFEVSGQWPITNRWYGVSRVNYSIRDRKVAESLVGLEYKADCWIFRAVAQRVPTATGVAASSIFLQLELNGLSKLGSDPIEALQRNVPGYQIINQP